MTGSRGRPGDRTQKAGRVVVIAVSLLMALGAVTPASANGPLEDPVAGLELAATYAVATDTVATDTVATDTVATDTVATDTVATDALSADTVPMVPVVDFWSTRRGISLAGLRAAVAGRHAAFDRVLVGLDDLDAITARLGVAPGPSTTAAPPDQVLRAVRGRHRILGLVPAGAVRATVKALPLTGVALFGSGRVAGLEEWPLLVPTPLEGTVEPFDPTLAWTLIAGGDVMLDREVHRQAVMLGKGPHYPWRGGVARVVSRRCCTAWGEPTITALRVGRTGTVRTLLRAADVALVNHEGPAPDRHRYHPSGFTFSFDPALEVGLRRSGIDVVSLANNHIRDAGSRGVWQTVRNVRAAGLRTVGAGRDLESARRGTCLDVRGIRLCLLAYDGVDMTADSATGRRAGAAPLRPRVVRADVGRLRREGADAVVVIPHWGPEYVDRPVRAQRRLALGMARAGADLVLGAHSHVAGALGHVEGTPVVYSMGDLLFDLTRFERTLEGVLVEVTFIGGRPTQIALHPTVLVDRSQVNLLPAHRGGRVVIERMRRASR